MSPRKIRGDLGDDPFLGGGQTEGEPGPEPGDQLTRHVLGDSPRRPLQGSLAQDQGELNPEELVEHQPFPGGGDIAHRLGKVYPGERGGAIDEVEALPYLGRQRFGQTSAPALAQGRLDPRTDLPGGDPVLLALGVEGNDASGPVAADQVDHRVRQLTAALEHLDPTEEHRLGPDGKLTLPPALVEEADPQVARTVTDLGGDEDLGGTAPGPPARDAGHGGDDHGFVPRRELTDRGLAGAVQVPTGVVGDQIQDVLHAQFGQPGDLLGLGG